MNHDLQINQNAEQAHHSIRNSIVRLYLQKLHHIGVLDDLFIFRFWFGSLHVYEGELEQALPKVCLAAAEK